MVGDDGRLGRDDDPRTPAARSGGGGTGSGGIFFNLADLVAIYQQLGLGRPSPEDYQFWLNEAQTKGFKSLQELRAGVSNTDEARAAGAPASAAPPPGAGPSPGAVGSLYGPFGPFQGRFQPLQGTPTQWAQIPQAPQWRDIPRFNAPTMEQAKADPGYAFGLQQGEQALTQDKAQQGLLYGGGTLKDILAWGQNYATQRYNDVYNRQRDQYMLNAQNQYILPYQAQMQQWQTLVPTAQRQNEFLSNQQYQRWLQEFNMWNSNRNYALDAASRLG